LILDLYSGVNMPIEAKSAVNGQGYLEIAWRLDPEALEFIQGVGETKTYNDGEQIVSQGDPGDAMFIILEGAVRVTRDISVGEQFLAKLEADRSFGEIALLTNSPRTASVTADGPVRVLRISMDNLNRLSVDNPRIAVQIYRILAESLAESLRHTGTIPSQLESSGRKHS
jgi:CRP-like cAMP-binding protein